MRRLVVAPLVAAGFLLPALLAPAVSAAALSGLDSEEIAAVEAINELRADLGLPALRVSPILTEAAEWMAADLASRDTIDHTDSLGRSMGTRVHSFSYPTNATIRENLVVGTGLNLGIEAVEAWQDSPGHRANNEAGDVTVAGIARVHAPETQWKWFWVLNLGSVADTGTTSTGDLQQAPVTGNQPIGTEPGTFTLPFPTTGVGLTQWNGGTLDAMVEAARVGGARSIFMTVNGKWVGYSIGSPAFVNAAFAAQFQGGNVPAGAVMLIVK